MKKFLAGLSAVAVLAAGGVAMVGLTSDTAIAQEDTTTTEGPAEGEAQLEGKRGHRGHGLSVAAEAIGIETEDLVAAIRDGATIAEVAEANGSSGQAVIDAMVAGATERIDAAVADGKLTAEEGAEKLADVTARITDLVNNEFDFSQRGERGERGPRGPHSEDVDGEDVVDV